MEQRISIERLEQAVNIFGSFDENIRLLEQEFHVTVVNRDGELRVEGDAEDTMLACKAIQALLTLSSRGEEKMGLVLQREVVTLSGDCLGCQEFFLPRGDHVSPLYVLACAGVQLLLGVPPEEVELGMRN